MFLVRFGTIAVGEFQLGWSCKNRLVPPVTIFFFFLKWSKEWSHNKCLLWSFNLSNDIYSKQKLERVRQNMLSERTPSFSNKNRTWTSFIFRKLPCSWANRTLCSYFNNCILIQPFLDKNNHQGVVLTLNMEKWYNRVCWWVLVLTIITHRNPCVKRQSDDTYRWLFSLRSWVLRTTCLDPSFPIRQFYSEATHKCKWTIFLLSATL